jgi:hypothetical protein
MIKATIAAVGLAAVFNAIVVSGQQRGGGQTPAAPPAPAPRGTAAIYVSGSDLEAAMKKAIAANPDMSTARIDNHDQYRINIVRRGKPAGAIAHSVGTELHYIVEGSGTIVTGGTIVRPPAGAPQRSRAV